MVGGVATGLAVDADLDDADLNAQLLTREINAGLLDQMSLSFRATDQAWNADYTERRIVAADIHPGDVSIVNNGANDATTVSVRASGPRTPPARAYAGGRWPRPSATGSR